MLKAHSGIPFLTFPFLFRYQQLQDSATSTKVTNVTSYMTRLFIDINALLYCL